VVVVGGTLVVVVVVGGRLWIMIGVGFFLMLNLREAFPEAVFRPTTVAP
jgi:type IV secretory pathway TrbD component